MAEVRDNDNRMNQDAENMKNLFDEKEYSTNMTYAEMLTEIKRMLVLMDEREYDDVETLQTAVFTAYKEILKEFRSSGKD